MMAQLDLIKAGISIQAIDQMSEDQFNMYHIIVTTYETVQAEKMKAVGG